MVKIFFGAILITGKLWGKFKICKAGNEAKVLL
jgi:hypothetical protein